MPGRPTRLCPCASRLLSRATLLPSGLPRRCSRRCSEPGRQHKANGTESESRSRRRRKQQTPTPRRSDIRPQPRQLRQRSSNGRTKDEHSKRHSTKKCKSSKCSSNSSSRKKSRSKKERELGHQDRPPESRSNGCSGDLFLLTSDATAAACEPFAEAASLPALLLVVQSAQLPARRKRRHKQSSVSALIPNGVCEFHRLL